MALEITDANIKEVLSENNVVLVDIWAPWCAPCKTLIPIIDALSIDNAGKAIVGKLLVDNNKETAAKYGIRNIPTLLFFKDGVIADKIVGMASKSVMQEKINALLA